MQDMIYKIKADFLKTLGHPMRLKLIEELKGGEKSVGYLVDKFKIGQSSISRHLLALRNAGILTSRQEKTTVYYDIADHDLPRFTSHRGYVAQKVQSFRKNAGYSW